MVLFAVGEWLFRGCPPRFFGKKLAMVLGSAWLEKLTIGVGNASIGCMGGWSVLGTSGH